MDERSAALWIVAGLDPKLFHLQGQLRDGLLSEGGGLSLLAVLALTRSLEDLRDLLAGCGDLGMVLFGEAEDGLGG